MQFVINMYNSCLKELQRINKLSWSLYDQNNIAHSLKINQQFYNSLERFKPSININKIEIQQLLNYQQILYKLLIQDGTIKILSNDNYTILYKVDEDNEVSSFEGFIKSTKKINLKYLYEHIDAFLEKYESSSESIPLVFSYNNKKINPDNIHMDISYLNDGCITLNLNKNGYFKGDSLFLLKDIGFDYEKDFKLKILDILNYFNNIYEK
jgi:hypothetical protein